jgi:DNA-binding XRE family transcriptional regulator
MGPRSGPECRHAGAYSQLPHTRVIVLAATRNDSDRTQDELAKLVGVSRNVIANIESGRKMIELTDFLALSDDSADAGSGEECGDTGASCA